MLINLIGAHVFLRILIAGRSQPVSSGRRTLVSISAQTQLRRKSVSPT